MRYRKQQLKVINKKLVKEITQELSELPAKVEQVLETVEPLRELTRTFNLSAPSSAVGYPTWRPKNKTDSASLKVLVNSRSGSTVSRESDAVLYTHAGPEIAVLLNFLNFNLISKPSNRPIKVSAIALGCS